MEAPFLPLIKEGPRKVIEQPEDFIAFALAGRLDPRGLATSGPRVQLT
jgi:hypothetical protein